MFYLIREAVTNMAHQEYRYDARLEDQLGAFLKASVQELSAGQVYAFVNNFGCILANEEENVFICDEMNNSEKPLSLDNDGEKSHKISALTVDKIKLGHDRNDLTAPITYQDKSLGRIVCQMSHDGIDMQRNNIFLALLGREVAFHVIRHSVANNVSEQLGKEFLFLGSSPQLREVEVQVEQSSKVDLPVMLYGEFGAELLHVACAIHFCSHRRENPFVEINCAAKKMGRDDSDPKRWLEQADGGTLFLNNIDQLDYELQNQLSALLEMAAVQWFSSFPTEGKPNVRIVAAANQDLSALVSENKFSRELHAGIDFLQIYIPSLRERNQDISAFIHYFLQKHRQHDEQCFSPEAISALEKYSWPGNVAEVERVIARLVVRSGKKEIQLEDIKHITPFVLDFTSYEAQGFKDIQKSAGTEYTDLLTESYKQEPINVALEELPRRVLSSELAFLDFHHPCIRKALKYISENYQNEITLAELAEAACVSPSHLCFLFRTELGTTFKSLLGMIRIEKAKNLLTEKVEMPITVISLEVGFRDLSHFERTFRRLVGFNPRDYRRRNRRNPGSQALSYCSL